MNEPRAFAFPLGLVEFSRAPTSLQFDEYPLNKLYEGSG